MVPSTVAGKRRAVRRLVLAAVFGAAAWASGALAPSAQAALVTTTWLSPESLGLTINDDGYNGSPASMTSHSITVGAGAGSVLSDIDVTVALSHTWIGDLTIKLRAPDGATVVLLNRPGLPGQADNGSGTGGDSSDWSPSFPITFDDQAPSGLLAEALGSTITGSKAVGDPTLANNPGDYGSFADGVTLVNGITPATLTALNGHLAPGVWTLFIGDSATGGTGFLDSWSLRLTTAEPETIPEPASAALLGLGGLLVLRRPRRA